MRVHLDRDVVAIRRRLSEQHRAELRERLEELKTDPAPDWTVGAARPPGAREFFLGGYWFGYTITRTGGETVIIVGGVEEHR
jgi:hypothetical protein